MLTTELIAKAMSTDPAQVGHYIEGGFMHPRIKPVDESFKMVGPAFTVRCPTNDNTAIYYAMKKAPKGSVIVIDRLGEDRFACCGEIVALSAKSLGMAGIVIDGPSTDTMALKKIGLPVFSSGRSAVTNTLLGINGVYNIPVNCGGTVVNPGDIIFGDIDGVIVADPSQFADLVDKAVAADLNEVRLREQIVNGVSLYDLMNIQASYETNTLAMLGALLKQ